MKLPVLMLLFISTHCVFSEKIISKELEFIPTETYDSLQYPKSNIWKTHRLLIKPIQNNTSKLNKIGEITHSNSSMILETETDLSIWVENVLKYSFQKNNISVINSDPTIIFSGEILKFEIIGNDRLFGEISINVKLQDSFNNIIFNNVITSNISRSCESIGTIKCFELSSDIMIEWIKNFLNEPAISEAVVKSYQNTIILHDFNFLSQNLISEKNVPEKKPLLKKLGTILTCVGIAPIVTGLISKSKGNNEVAEPLFIIGSTTTSAGLTTTGISFAFDIKYNSFQSRFRRKTKVIKKADIKELTLH